MLRYRLKAPATTHWARANKDVFVSLDVAYREAHAPLVIDGPRILVEMVREALAEAHGFRGRSLSESLHFVMPLDLEPAMKHWSMQPFEPELVEGADVLERRRPPWDDLHGAPMTTDQLTEALGATFGDWLVYNLTRPFDVRSYDGEHFFAQVESVVFMWTFWRPHQATPEQAAAALAVPLAAEHAAQEARLATFSEPLVRELLAPTSMTFAQATDVARVFVRGFDATPDEYERLLELVPHLQRELAALGLTAR